MPRAEPARRRSALSRFGLGVAVLYALLAVATAVAFLTSASTNEPLGCDGIGFGCTLPPDDAAVVAGVLVGLALLPVCGVVGLLVALLGRRRRAGRTEPQ